MPRNLPRILKDERGTFPIYLSFFALAAFLLLIVFGPGIGNRLGFLGERKEQQKSLAQTPLAPPPGDSDQDGFTDEVERWVKTDYADNCPDDGQDAAWPPDFNNDRLVNTNDVNIIKNFFNTKAGDNRFNRRYDLNADKSINSLDVYIVSQYLNKGCPFLFMSTPKVDGQIVSFFWTPTTETPVLISAIDLTKTPINPNCNSAQAYQSGAFTSSVGIGQRSFVWSGAQPGHQYCAALLLSNPLFSYLVSNPVNFIIPAPTDNPIPPTLNPTPTPTPAPALYCTIVASPQYLNLGGSSALSYTTSGATSAYIDQGIGRVPLPTGSVSVSPQQTTTYTMTVIGSSTTQYATCNVTIYIVYPTPTPPPPPY